MTRAIHPAGSVLSDLIVEPLGNYEYIWFKKPNLRGVSVAYKVYEGDNEDGETRRSQKNKLLYWAIDIDNEQYMFSGSNANENKPLRKVIFYVPNRDKIEDWLGYLTSSKDIQTIFDRTRHALHIALDLPIEFYYDILLIAAFQSWVVDKLDSVFYAGIVGGFGGGKTVSLEVLKSLCKHGMMVGDISNAGVARTCSKYKLSLMYDELDARNMNKDSELLATLRQGQRRGNPYLRLQQKTFEEEIYDIFGFKAYTMHSDLEKALKMRTLMANIGETSDKRLPIINSLKEGILSDVYDDLFFWYLEHIVDIPESKEDFPIVVKLDDNLTVEQTREEIYRSAVRGFNPDFISLLSEFRGRNVELAYTSLRVSKMFGIDITASLLEAFREKKSLESEYNEGDVSGIVKDVLLAFYEENKTFVKRKEVFEKANQELDDQHFNRMSNYAFTRELRNFGFIDRISMKKREIVENDKKKVVLCLFFDDRVKYKLGILTELTPNDTNSNSSSIESVASKESVESVESVASSAIDKGLNKFLIAELAELAELAEEKKPVLASSSASGVDNP